MGNRTSLDRLDFGDPDAFDLISKLDHTYPRTQLPKIIQKLNNKFNKHHINNPVSFRFVKNTACLPQNKQAVKLLLLECLNNLPTVLIDIILDYSYDCYLLLSHELNYVLDQYSRLYVANDNNAMMYDNGNSNTTAINKINTARNASETMYDDTITSEYIQQIIKVEGVENVNHQQHIPYLNQSHRKPLFQYRPYNTICLKDESNQFQLLICNNRSSKCNEMLKYVKLDLYHIAAITVNNTIEIFDLHDMIANKYFYSKLTLIIPSITITPLTMNNSHINLLYNNENDENQLFCIFHGLVLIYNLYTGQLINYLILPHDYDEWNTFGKTHVLLFPNNVLLYCTAEKNNNNNDEECYFINTINIDTNEHKKILTNVHVFMCDFNVLNKDYYCGTIYKNRDDIIPHYVISVFALYNHNLLLEITLSDEFYDSIYFPPHTSYIHTQYLEQKNCESNDRQIVPIQDYEVIKHNNGIDNHSKYIIISYRNNCISFINLYDGEILRQIPYNHKASTKTTIIGINY